jgi:hypothetical protein
MCCLKYPVREQILPDCVAYTYIFFIFIYFRIEKFKILYCCKHLLYTLIVHFTESCPKNASVSDFSGDISTPIFFAMFYNVNSPLCKLRSEFAIMTCSPAKRRVSIFVVVDKVITFV